MWTLSIMTGLRRGEVVGLQWTDIDPDGGRPSVERARSMAARRKSVGPPKAASSKRTIGLDEATVAALRSYRIQQTQERLLSGGAWANTDN
jgi:integrase